MLRSFFEILRNSYCHYYNNVYLHHMKGTVNKCQGNCHCNNSLYTENTRT